MSQIITSQKKLARLAVLQHKFERGYINRDEISEMVSLLVKSGQVGWLQSLFNNSLAVRDGIEGRDAQ